MTARAMERRSLDGGYPPLRSVSEPQLRQVERVESCACGRRIYQLVGDDVMRTVSEHNATHDHLTWRRRAGNAPTAVVDVSFGASGRPLP